MGLPETASFAEFATLGGWKKSWVTQLRRDGRLVLTDDQKRVRVAESFGLIKDTEDPSRSGVAARHAARRVGTAAAGQEAEPDPDDEEPALPNDGHARRRAKALADKEEALARKALREEQVEMGQLLVRDEVIAVVAEVVVRLRNRLEQLAPTLAPALAATTDESQVRVQLRDGIEEALHDLVKSFAALARAEA